MKRISAMAYQEEIESMEDRQRGFELDAERVAMFDPQVDPDYQALVASMLPFCRCDFDRPCDGVLAGGPCDQRRERLDEYDYDYED